MEALRTSANLRKSLQVIGPIIGTSIAGLLQLASKFSPESWITGLNIGSASIAVFVIVIATLLAITDRSGPEALREAYSSSELVKQLQMEHASARVDVEKAAIEFSALTTLYVTSSALREFIQPVISEGPGDVGAQSARLSALIDILLSNKQELFGISDERWNFSIYLIDEEGNSLRCAACRRRDRADEVAEHRTWPVGIGQIGLAFRDQVEVVVGDVQNPEFEAYFRAPPSLYRADDGDRYRSIAAVPISANGIRARGVVIATSDVPGRFVPSSAKAIGERDTVEPLRVLAGTLVILLTATEMHGRLGEKNV